MKKRFAWAAAAVLVAAQSMTVLAGGINAYESSVISVACGTFTYNGKTYVAKAAYQAQLQAKLAEDGIDLTQEQANEAISLIYANVETGVVQGYLEEVGGASEETEESENTDDREKETDKKRKTEDGSPEKDSQREESASSEVNQSQMQNSSPAAAAEQPTEAAGDTWSIGEAIEADEGASDYEGYNIKEIYEKEEEDRTGEEQQAYDQYLAEKAVDQLHLGEDEPQAQESSKKTEQSRYLSKSNIRILSLAAGILAGAAILAMLALRAVRERKAALLKKELPDIYIDIHSHILPGVDDGSPDMETTMKMAGEARRQGIRYMIATPHYQSGKKHLKVEALKEVYEQTREAVEKQYPDFHLLLGNEIYYSDGCIEKLEQGRALTLAGSRYVLIEFAIDSSVKQITEAVVTLLRERYIPILAHAERYQNLVKDLEAVREIRSMGAWIQINASCRGAAVKLIRHGCADLLATDCHDLDKRAPKLKKGLHRLCLYGDKRMLDRILVQNPRKMITTEENREEN